MTIFATGADTRIAFVKEATPGTTPATPAMTIMPVVKFDLELSQTTHEDNSIFADRQEHYVIAGNRKVTGSISANLSHTNFNALIETVLFNAFASKVGKTGTVLKTLTFEEWHADVTEGFVYTGVFGDKAQIKVPVNGIVTLDATLNGFASTASGTVIGASYAAPTNEIPFTHLGGTISEGGSVIAYLTAIDISIDNSATAEEVLGSQTPVGYAPGMSKITGTITAFFPDLTLYNKFLAQTSTSVEFQLTDGTNTVDVLLPAAVYTGAKHPVQGQGPVVISLPFKAVKDPTAQSNIVITYS